MSTIVVTVWTQVGYADALLNCCHTPSIAVKENECRRCVFVDSPFSFGIDAIF